MKRLAKKILPPAVQNSIRSFKNTNLVREIEKLNIAETGTDGEDYWLKLENGLTFFGPGDTDLYADLYKALGPRIPDMEPEHFNIVYEIINRYVAPRSIPGELFYHPSTYNPLRDPLNDYDLMQEKKAEIAALFQPQKGDTFFDIGAFHGYGTLKIAERIGETGKIVAIETDPDCLRILRKNLQANNIGNVIVVDKAAGAKEGKAQFFRHKTTINSLHNNVLSHLGHDQLHSIDVSITTMDTVAEQHDIQKIDIANITINGAEHEALEGMEKTLAQSENLRLTIAGWYYLPDHQKKVCEVVGPFLEERGFTVMIGKLGRVLAWKSPS